MVNPIQASKMLKMIEKRQLPFVNRTLWSLLRLLEALMLAVISLSMGGVILITRRSSHRQKMSLSLCINKRLFYRDCFDYGLKCAKGHFLYNRITSLVED
jgi:hypothetical protein